MSYYQPWGYPMMNAQQRLAQMEQQYPQLAQQYGNPMGSYPAPQQMQPQTAQTMTSGLLKGRAVTSIDEAKAAMIDLDGTPNIFTDFANGRIYVKYTTLNGTAALDVYSVQVSPSAPQGSSVAPGQEYVSVGLFNDKIAEIQSSLANLSQQLSGMAQTRKGENNVQLPPANSKSAKPTTNG